MKNLPENDHDRWRRMIELHLLGELPSEEFAELNAAMRETREVRDLYRRACHIDVRLQRLDIHPPATVPETAPAKSLSYLAGPIGAAVVGLLLGVFCTSIIWAASTSTRQTILTLLHESFEAGTKTLPQGGPVDAEAWGGDYAKIVGAASGIAPLHGERMFRFLRADYDGKNRIGYVGDIYRVIDLRDQTAMLASGDAVVAVDAAFGSTLADPDRFYANISLHALDAIPANGDAWRDLISTPRRLEEIALALGRRREAITSETPWQRIHLDMRLPADAQYLLVGLHVSDLKAVREHGNTPPAVQFDGLFADDVRVTLRNEKRGH